MFANLCLAALGLIGKEREDTASSNGDTLSAPWSSSWWALRAVTVQDESFYPPQWSGYLTKKNLCMLMYTWIAI